MINFVLNAFRITVPEFRTQCTFFLAFVPEHLNYDQFLK